MVAGLTPRDKNKDFKDLQDEVMRLRDSVRFTSPTVNAGDSTGFGFGSKTQEIPPIGGLFALEPQIVEVALELEYTGGVGELITGDLVTTDANGWQGKFVEWIDGNDIAGRAVFTPQNTTAFSDEPQTLSVSGGWTATYTVGTVKQNRLPLQSSSIVVDDINANYEVQTITGTINNGQFLILKPIDTKTLTLKTGGNIDITSDVSVADNEIAILQFHEDNKSPDANGNYNVLVTNGGGAANVPDGTAENDHIEWDNTGLVWLAQQFFEMGSAGPHASLGDIRFKNNSINLAWRNAADDGDVEIKLDNTDRLDITENNNGGVALVLRAQNAIDPDQRFQFDQFSGTGGSTIVTFPTTLLFSRVGTNTLLLSSTGVSIEDLNLENVTNIEGRDDGTPFKIIFDNAEDADTFISDDITTADRINVTAGGTTFFSWIFDGSKNIFGVPTGITAELEMSTNDILGVDRLRFSQTGNTGSPFSPIDHVIFLDPTDDMTFNSPSVDKFQWTFLNNIGASLSWQDGTPPSGRPILQISTASGASTDIPLFIFNKDDPTPLSGNIGAMQFFANDSTDVQQSFVNLIGAAVNVISTNIAGSFSIDCAEGGASPTTYMRFNDLDSATIKVFRDINMNTNDINLIDRLTFQKTGNTGAPVSNIDAAIFLDSTNDMTFNLGNVDKFQWSFQVLNALTLERNPSVTPTFGPVMQLNSPSVLIPSLRIVQENPSPGVTLVTGQIEFFANRLDLTNIDVGGITASLRDTTTSHEGTLVINVAEAGGSPSTYMVFNSPISPNQVRILRDIDMNSPFSPGVIDNVGNIRSDIFTVVNSDVGGNPSITSAFTTLSASILGDWLPTADNTHDLGKTPGNRWRDLRLAGSGNIGTLNIGLGDSSIQHTMFGFMTIVDRVTPADPVSASSVQFFLDDSSGELSVRKFGGNTVSLETGGAGAGGGAGLTFASVVKSVDQSIISEILFQPDDELRFDANADSTYGFTLNLLFSSDSVAGFEFKWSSPTGTTIEWEVADDRQTLDQTEFKGTNPTGVGVIQVIQVTGRVITGSTAGIINLQFSQMILTASNTTIHQGSWLRVYEEGASELATAGALGPIHTKVTKAVDDEVPNSTVLVNDSELFFKGTANKTYHLTLMLFMNSPATADMKINWSLPTGATGKRIPNNFSWFFGGQPSEAVDITTQVDLNTNGTDGHLQFHATITMGSTDGTVNFQFAQGFADASPAKMLKGTTLLVYEEGTSTSENIEAVSGLIPFVKIIKPSDESVTNSAIFQNDDDFKFGIAANKTHSFRMILIFDGESGLNIKTKWSVPTGTKMRWSAMFDGVSLTHFAATEADERILFTAGTGSFFRQIVQLYGTIISAGTPGTVQFQWAQEGTTATPITIFQGSTIIVDKL